MVTTNIDPLIECIDGIQLSRDLKADELKRLTLTRHEVDTYFDYRAIHPLEKYRKHFSSVGFPVGERFWQRLDILFCIGFCEALADYSRIPGAAANRTFFFIATVIPKVILSLLPTNTYSQEEALQIIGTCCPAYIKMVYEEIALQYDFLTKLKGDKIVALSDLVTPLMHSVLRSPIEAEFRKWAEVAEKG